MEIAYWIVAGLLALFYAYSGTMKLTRTQEQLAPMMKWAGTTIPMSGVRGIGLLEVVGAIALIVPPLFNIHPDLAIASAFCLTVLQVLAALFHLFRREAKLAQLNLVLIVLSVLVGWLATSVV